MSDFVEYEDAELQIRIPSYLHAKRGMRFFEPRGRQKMSAIIFGMSVDFINLQSVDDYRSQFFTRQGATEWYLDGRKTTTIRSGKSKDIEGGLECLTITHLPAGDDLLFGYGILLPIGERYINVGINGRRDQTEFEKACKEIVSSIKLKPGAVHPPRQKRIGNQLRRKDETRLKAALQGLPPTIAYLRLPILAIAKEDQDLLSSGEGDISPLVKAFKKHVKKGDIALVADRDAGDLHAWLEGLPGNDGTWAAPAWFVEGALRGASIFTDDT
jgi:hypothetical protein